MFTFRKLEEITKGRVLQFHQDTDIVYLLLDSRKIISPRTSLFFAISGKRHDGHKFIPELYKKGVRGFVVENNSSFKISDFPEANIIQVQDAVLALQKLVAAHRAQFSYPVIGITGSNGKTIIKEWLSQLLSKDFNIVRSPKSYNSQTGVPLSVWEMNQQHTLGIFEAGISLRDEMKNLQKVIRPSIGIFSNIGTAHDEGFGSRKEKISEKLQLFKDVEVLVYCADHEEIDEEVKAQYPALKIFTWSHFPGADISIREQIREGQQSRISLSYKGQSYSFSIPFADNASVENLMHCLAILLYLKLDAEEIQSRIHNLQPVAMRLELKEGINSCYLIDDSYNNDLAGINIALNFMDQQKSKEGKTVILSDVLQSGLPEEELYQKIGALLKEKEISKLIGIGPVISKHRNCFEIESLFYESTSDFLNAFDARDFAEEIILVKGARVFEFEKITQRLQQKVHGTILEVNLDALSSNLNFYRSFLKPQTKVMVMVKAFAYGSGSFEVANLLQFHRVDYLAVAYADEGVALRERGISLPIMVMNPSYQTFDKMFQYNMEPELYNFKILREYLEFLTLHAISSRIHIKIDTGMHRLGFEEKDIPELISLLKNNTRVNVASVFTHLAGADEETHNEFTLGQLSRFKKIASTLEDKLGYKTIKHALNSAGIVRFPEAQMDMIRLGIGLYGVEANGLKQGNIETVGTLKTIISQIKEVKAGDSVGYSRKGKAEKDIRIATIAIGYADGYDRRFSGGKGKVLINGKLCPIIGNVCMDMSMVDITGVDAREGDEVIVFGKDLPIYKIAEEIGTIPYEILTNVSERVKRVFYTE
ncbi:MAG: bifunctional UDP-N-acetylmuramoyl-tripeptide:D-alanyl-D-alanine ligase/alanine racemase [Cytophagaceae bacterium]